MQKTAIVTGGSRGIGFAVAKRLGLDGFQIVIMATKPCIMVSNNSTEKNEKIMNLGILQKG